jgi:hypothetical protein
MCATVGVTDADCRPIRVTGVRYIVDRVTQTETAARIAFRAQVCRNDAPCLAPSAAQEEDLEQAEGRWRFRSNPQIYARACRP